jgi:putative membrane protein insertion efficiency factor
MRIEADEACCFCCMGLFLGYLIFGSNGDGDEPKTKNYPGNLTSVVESKKENNFLLKQINNYQMNIGPNLKKKIGKEKICKYEPSCSEYAKQAIEKHGSVKGSLMASSRILRCNPLSKGGYDPVK